MVLSFAAPGHKTIGVRQAAKLKAWKLRASMKVNKELTLVCDVPRLLAGLSEAGSREKWCHVGLGTLAVLRALMKVDGGGQQQDIVIQYST